MGKEGNGKKIKCGRRRTDFNKQQQEQQVSFCQWDTWSCPCLSCSSCSGVRRWNSSAIRNNRSCFLYALASGDNGSDSQWVKMSLSEAGSIGFNDRECLFLCLHSCIEEQYTFSWPVFNWGITNTQKQRLARRSQVCSSESRTIKVVVRDVKTATSLKFISPRLPWCICFLFGLARVCFFKLTFQKNWNILSFPFVQMYRRENSVQLGTCAQLGGENFLRNRRSD